MLGFLSRNAACTTLRVLQTRQAPSLLRPWVVPSMIVSARHALLSSAAVQLNETAPNETGIPMGKHDGSPSFEPPEPSDTLFISNLPFHVTDRDVVAVFENMPGFLELKSPANRQSKGYSFVTFSSLDDAKAAHEHITNEMPKLGGRQIRVSYSRQHQSVVSQAVSSTVFVANLSGQITNDALREPFSKFGDVVDVRITQLDGNRSIAWVKFMDDSQAQAAVTALQRKPIEPDGNPIRLDFAVNKDRDRTTPDSKPNERLFIAGFGSHPPEEVAELFNRFQVKSFKVAIDPVSNEPRGYGWVEFETTAHAMTAMDTILSEKVSLKGTPLRIEFAAPRMSSKTQRNRKERAGKRHST